MPDLALSGERLIAATENARAPFTVNYTAISTNTPGTPASAETVWITTPTITFKAGRAYRMTVKGLLTPNAASSEGRIRVRRDTIAGVTVFDSFRITTPSASANYGFEYSNIFVNAGSSSILAPLLGTLARDSGTASYHLAATATHAGFLLTEDFGPAGDFPGATTL